MREIPIQAEHREELDFYLDEFKRYNALRLEEEQRFDRAKQVTERLYGASVRLSKLGLGVTDVATCRNAEILTHFLQQAREANEKLALYHNITQALREALSLFLADSYGIDVSVEWYLDLDEGMLRFNEEVEHAQ